MFKSIAWSILKPIIRSWLQNRALVLPVAKRNEIAGRLKLSGVQVGEVNAEIIKQALEEVETFKP